MKSTFKLAGLFLASIILLTSVSGPSYAQSEIEPVVPALASFILPGFGQLINEQPEKALTHFIVDVGIVTAAYFISYPYYKRAPYVPVGTLHLAWSAYSAYDAYTVAEDRNRTIFGSTPSLQPENDRNLDLNLASSPLTLDNSDRLSVSNVKGN